MRVIRHGYWDSGPRPVRADLRVPPQWTARRAPEGGRVRGSAGPRKGNWDRNWNWTQADGRGCG